MQRNTRAIVLSSLKYGDASLIVKAFTASDGLMTYMIKGVLASRRGKLKPSYFQPLTQLEIVSRHRQSANIHYINEARIYFPYSSIPMDVAKQAIALFLAEVLSGSIREQEKNERLYQYLEASLQWLDTHETVANFHLYFLIHLSKYLGFFPAKIESGSLYFDLVEGVFTKHATAHPVIQGIDLENFEALLGTNFEAFHKIGLNKTERQDLLEALILYFELHLQGFKRPRSLAVLNEVFR